MSIARIRLLLATIEERNKMQFKANAKLHEWSAKTIAQVVAATTGKEGKELQKAVAKISLSFADEENLEQVDADTLYAASPGADNEAYVQEGSSSAVNQPGSFEALLRGFH